MFRSLATLLVLTSLLVLTPSAQAGPCGPVVTYYAPVCTAPVVYYPPVTCSYSAPVCYNPAPVCYVNSCGVVSYYQPAPVCYTPAPVCTPTVTYYYCPSPAPVYYYYPVCR